MLNASVLELLNSQINKEFYSAYLYLDMAGFYATAGLAGFENWFKVQAQEERDHAMLFRQYVQNNGHHVVLKTIEDPTRNYADYKQPLDAALEHEQFVTASINEIYTEALAVKDYRTVQFLDWFIKEQGEEEKNSEENIRKFELFGSEPKGLYLLDQALGARAYAPPSLILG